MTKITQGWNVAFLVMPLKGRLFKMAPLQSSESQQDRGEELSSGFSTKLTGEFESGVD